MTFLGRAMMRRQFDPATVERYRVERDRRLVAARDDVLPLRGDLGSYLTDPHTKLVRREPVFESVEVAVIGAGFGGLIAATHAKRNGASRVRLIDKAGDVGGVWYWNRYPGVRCDVESYIYLPFLEETGYMPSEKYVSGAEILRYTQHLARTAGLYHDALFHTTVREMAWQEGEGCWRLRTDRGDVFDARFVVLAHGLLHALKLPNLRGIEQYSGHSFHTSRWDYTYTGGDPDSRMIKLGTRRIGVVGTGATAIQCVPKLAEDAGHVYVFQRTPSTVAERNNYPTDAEWFQSLRPGWQRERMQNFTGIVTGLNFSSDLVNDKWTEIYRDLVHDQRSNSYTSPDEIATLTVEADHMWMDRIRARIDQVVTDRQTAEALKPYYRYLCKRPCFHDEYLSAFNRANVTLVDTNGRGVQRCYAGGVIANDQEYQLDCIIFATGFEFEAPIATTLGFDAVGRGGQLLSHHWRLGLRTLHGLFSRGFPNMFIVPGVRAQSGVTQNFSHAIQENGYHIGYVIGQCLERGVRTFEVSRGAEDSWVETVVRTAKDDRSFLEECTPGVNNKEGNVDSRPRQNANYGPGALELFNLLAEWRSADMFEGLELS
jgi:cation diffusion facilitator CzcD-associated flavoprotein CzcO